MEQGLVIGVVVITVHSCSPTACLRWTQSTLYLRDSKVSGRLSTSSLVM
jgi:hypothetical protein